MEDSYEKKTVFVIVRETVEVKDRLWKLARKNGFDKISDFIRNEWRKWL